MFCFEKFVVVKTFFLLIIFITKQLIEENCYEIWLSLPDPGGGVKNIVISSDIIITSRDRSFMQRYT